MHSSWFRSSFVVAGGTWRWIDGTFWCQEDREGAVHSLLLAKDEARCRMVRGSVRHIESSSLVLVN